MLIVKKKCGLGYKTPLQDTFKKYCPLCTELDIPIYSKMQSLTPRELQSKCLAGDPWASQQMVRIGTQHASSSYSTATLTTAA